MVRARPVLTMLTALLLAVPGITALSSAARAADADLAVNGGFESGLSGWSCTAGSGTTVNSPVHSGGSALQATPAGRTCRSLSWVMLIEDVRGRGMG
ncbi:hypothetical protein EDD90_3350 [Streptomyces sp. Ag109_O5-1]|nr:hypothetical protein EDD90_3350 [Streptomyces sp. Ag109_O5-1]